MQNDKDKKQTTSSTSSVTAQYLPDDHPSNNQQLIDLFEKQMRDNPPESTEERRQREKREKWEGVISGLSDAASAVTNLLTTTKYAPDMYNPSASMTKAAQDRFDKAKAERDAHLQQHLNYAMNIGKLKDAERGWRYRLAKDRRDAEWKAREDEREKKKDEREEKLLKPKLKGLEADAKRKETAAKYEPEYQKARVGKVKADTGASNARAKHYANGGSTRNEFLAYDKNGKEHWFHDPRAAEQFARREGTWKAEQKKSTSTKEKFGRPETTETTTEDGGYSRKPYSHKTKSPLQSANTSQHIPDWRK